jgi:putative transposon-encoded protein
MDEIYCFTNPRNPLGEFEFEDCFSFGAHKGMKLKYVFSGKKQSYFFWLTHALTAEKFTINLSKDVIKNIDNSARIKMPKVYIDGKTVKYQMAKYYKDKFIAPISLPEKLPLETKKESSNAKLLSAIELLKKEMS